MLIVVTVEAEQLPIAAVRRIIVMVVVLVMDRELAQLFAVKFASAVGTDPGKEFERVFAEGLVPLRLVPQCHESLAVDGDRIQFHSTASFRRIPVMGNEIVVAGL